MSWSLRLYMDDATAKRMELLAQETGRELTDLASAAVAEAALNAFRGRTDDPAGKPLATALDTLSEQTGDSSDGQSAKPA